MPSRFSNRGHGLIRRLPATWLAVAVIAASLRAESIVTLRASADPEYLMPRTTEFGVWPETFVVMKGRFFGGISQDPTMERMPFARVAGLLAHDLKRRQYHSAKDFESADLLLLIHWGVTVPSVSQFQEEPHNDATTVELTDAKQRFNEAAASGNVAEAEQARADIDCFAETRHDEALVTMNDSLTGQAIASNNAELLGLSGELGEDRDALFGSLKAETVDGMMREEHYFVVVFAFDAKVLRDRRRLKCVCSVRLSTHAAGINFVTALDRKSAIGWPAFRGTRFRLAHRSRQESRREDRLWRA